MYSKITQEIDSLILSYYKEHNTLYGLEKEVNITITRLYKRLNKLGVKPNGKGRTKKFTTIVCYKCNKDKTLENYYPDSSRRTGFCYICKDCFREQRRLYTKQKRETDPLFNLSKNIRCLISYTISKKEYKKKLSTEEILGCTCVEFKKYLESKFESWMNWDNYGNYNGTLDFGWDVDHIIPISSAKTEEELYTLNHYTNMRPLCSYTNRYIKRNKTQNESKT